MSGAHAPAPQELHQLGLRATAPRLKVLERLRAGPQRHWTADALHRELLAAGDDIGLATVYRVLGQLSQAGIVRRTVFEGQTAVFEIDDGPHHDHLVCVHCGQVAEFADEVIERQQRHVARSRGFDLVDHRLALFGLCQACASVGLHGGRAGPAPTPSEHE